MASSLTIEKIGSGSFGTVVLIENNGEKFALKTVDLDNDSVLVPAENEIEILKELSHAHVLVYVKGWIEEDRLYILTEYCAGGDLNSFLKELKRIKRGPVPEDLLLVWLWQMACGLEYMHFHPSRRCILHRDLKPSNIYFTEDGTIRLGDMGIAKALEHSKAAAQTFVGTLPYMSPEALSGRDYTAKTDIWALGCCVVEMATLKMAYNAPHLFLLLKAVLHNERPHLPGTYDEGLDDLVGQMMCEDSDARLSSSELLEHDLLKNVKSMGAKPIQLLKKHDLEKCLAAHRKKRTSACDIDSGLGSTVSQIFEDGAAMTSYADRKNNRLQDRVDTVGAGCDTCDGSTMNTFIDRGENPTVREAWKTLTPSSSAPALSAESSWSSTSSGYSTSASELKASRSFNTMCDNSQLLLGGGGGKAKPSKPPPQKVKVQKDPDAATASESSEDDRQREILRGLTDALTKYLGKAKFEKVLHAVRTSSSDDKLTRNLLTVLGEDEAQNKNVAMAASYVVLLEVTINSRNQQ